jgi:hypothetical protein
VREDVVFIAEGYQASGRRFQKCEVESEKRPENQADPGSTPHK